eukprot:UN29183
MHLSAIGPDILIRERLRSRVRNIRKEDVLIQRDGGATNLSGSELSELLQERGMRVDKVPFELRRDLQGWFDLTQIKNTPVLLLILSRSLMINATAKDDNEAIRSTP